ncbi:MAG TPA: signal peptidase II [Clostridiales bacterium]|nr:signal peptidase II [Clostridiales bacterium]
MRLRIKHFLYLIILILIDQFSKYQAIIHLKDDKTITLIPKVLKLQYHENDGAVWGILSGQIIFLVIITLVILLLLLYLYLNIPKHKKFNALRIFSILIAAGAIGNLIDRVIFNYVVDFIYFELINFPIFNIADSFISVSAVLLVILSIFYYSSEDFKFIDDLFKVKRK